MVIRTAALLPLFLIPLLQAAKEPFVYIGTYTTGTESKGIYVYRFDEKTGKLTPVGTAESPNPSFLAIHPKGPYLYAANEAEDSVSAFSINQQDGTLTPLNRQPVRGKGPCFVAVDHTGHNLLVADYGDGSVAVLPLQADGKLGEVSTYIKHEGKGANPQRQSSPHAHSINLSPDNRFAVVPDLGIDKLMMYRFDAQAGKLTPSDPPFVQMSPGSGPRHFTFHPNKRSAYVINELASTVSAFAYNASTGTLTELQTLSTLPEGTDRTNNTTAEVQVHPNGRWLYGSNRGHDSIAVFRVDVGSGRLTAVENVSTQGNVPRNFRIDPTGHYLLAANQKSDSVVVFSIDQKTGRLKDTGQKISVPAPVCIKFVSAR